MEFAYCKVFLKHIADAPIAPVSWTVCDLEQALSRQCECSNRDGEDVEKRLICRVGQAFGLPLAKTQTVPLSIVAREEESDEREA